MRLRRSTSPLVAAIAVVLASTAAFAQSPKVPRPPAPQTHSQMMADMLDDSAAKLEVDRLDGDLRAIDTNILVVHGHLSRLRAAMAVKTNSATETELVRYREVGGTLQSIRQSVARAQLAISKCKTLCAEAEVAAAEEKAPPADHDKQMASLTASADRETKELAGHVARLREQTSTLPKDPNLPRLTEDLRKSVEALQKLIAVCKAALPTGTAGEQTKKDEAPPAGSTGRHNHH